ncbi:MAG TPA: 4-hydroxy-tetrahydrodipicolinate synthase [Actinomycetota bacterium]|nr:4-hydroxy-tetrahydrodipicolinate synthase [Actinomycetota bacterium]
MAGKFGAVVTAMVTPFTEELELDVGRAQELARWLVDHGNDGVVVAGSTGEGATLSDDEKVELWRAVVEAVGDRATVIANTGTNDTRQSIELTKHAEEAGADAVLVVAPYYNKPPQRGLAEHFTRVAGATSLPVMLYNVPGRTAVRIDHATIVEVAGRVENVVAVKDSTGDVDGVARLVAEAPDGFEVYSGDDWATFSFLGLGARGVVSVAGHVVGERIHDVVELVESGNVEAARKIDADLRDVYRALFITSNPIPVKKAMELIGQPAGPPRLPLVPATDEETAKIRKALEDAGAL